MSWSIIDIVSKSKNCRGFAVSGMALIQALKEKVR